MCRNSWDMVDSWRKWVTKGCHGGVTGCEDRWCEAGDTLRMDIGMVDSVRFGGGSKVLVHFVVFVRTM